eukprot:40677_1
MNEYDYTLYDIKYDSNSLSVTNNELCDNTSNFVYDNYNEHRGIIEINERNTGPVCCRGARSCYSPVSMTFTDIASDIVVCSGYTSCRDTTINTTKPVFCEADNSCMNTFINKANNVYCLGEEACIYSVFIECTNVYCLGSYACSRTTIQSNGNDINVYLFGYSSGWYTNIYCDIGDKCHIHCGGYYSCWMTIVLCDNNCFIDCNTDTGCPQTYNPTRSPSAKTLLPTKTPTLNPTKVTQHPTKNPTIYPTLLLTKTPTLNPTKNP